VWSEKLKNPAAKVALAASLLALVPRANAEEDEEGETSDAVVVVIQDLNTLKLVAEAAVVAIPTEEELSESDDASIEAAISETNVTMAALHDALSASPEDILSAGDPRLSLESLQWTTALAEAYLEGVASNDMLHEGLQGLDKGQGGKAPSAATFEEALGGVLTSIGAQVERQGTGLWLDTLVDTAPSGTPDSGWAPFASGALFDGGDEYSGPGVLCHGDCPTFIDCKGNACQGSDTSDEVTSDGGDDSEITIICTGDCPDFIFCEGNSCTGSDADPPIELFPDDGDGTTGGDDTTTGGDTTGGDTTGGDTTGGDTTGGDTTGGDTTGGDTTGGDTTGGDTTTGDDTTGGDDTDEASTPCNPDIDGCGNGGGELPDSKPGDGLTQPGADDGEDGDFVLSPPQGGLDPLILPGPEQSYGPYVIVVRPPGYGLTQPGVDDPQEVRAAEFEQVEANLDATLAAAYEVRDALSEICGREGCH
jgi:hypothetical protein